MLVKDIDFKQSTSKMFGQLMAGVVVVCLTLCSGYLRFFEDTGLNTVMLQNHNYLAIKHL